MSKLNDKALEIVKKQSLKKGVFKEKFETKTDEHPKNITTEESEKLKGFLCKCASENMEVEEDNLQLVKIADEIRSIQKQQVLLHGERIAKAQNILKNYKKGAFSYWLEMTYGNRRTPYNFFYYYSLYCLLPPDEKRLLKQMPPKIVYIIGGKKLRTDEKRSFVKENYNKPLKELEEMLSPKTVENEGEKPTISDLKKALKLLKKIAVDKNFSDEEQKVIQEIKTLVKSLL